MVRRGPQATHGQSLLVGYMRNARRFYAIGTAQFYDNNTAGPLNGPAVSNTFKFSPEDHKLNWFQETGW